MKEEIIKLRERLVELSKDPIETRELLDKLTEAEVEKANIESPFHVDKGDIEETKDFDFYKIHKTRKGYVIHYHGGYSILIDDNLLSTVGAVDILLSDNKDEDTKLAQSAVEMIFRLPMFVFSHPATTYTLAEVATRYMLYLQELGEVPTEETENPEYDKFIRQMNEMFDNFAKGLENEIKEKKIK